MATKKEKDARQKKIEYNIQRNKEKSVGVSIFLRKIEDADVIEQIHAQPNRTDYIRQLVRADIAKSNKE